MATVGMEPCFGRDYKTKKEVLADLQANKDFELSDMHGPYARWVGKYASPHDIAKAGHTISAHYDRRRKQTLFKPSEVLQ